jgi:hypothetical protein
MTLTPPVITPPKLTPHEIDAVIEACRDHFYPQDMQPHFERAIAAQIESDLNAKWSEMLAGQEAEAWVSESGVLRSTEQIQMEGWDTSTMTPLYTTPVPSHDRAMLIEARQELGGGLWDHGPGQDEHEACQALIERIDAHIAGAPVPAQAPAVAVPDDTRRLDALASPGWELSMNSDPECQPDELWQVHRVQGGRNDREWVLIGEGTSPRAAIDAAQAGEGGA